MTTRSAHHLRELEAAFRARDSSNPWYFTSPMVSLGFERLPKGAPYRWEGLRRGADPRKPSLTVQVTLEGFGVFRKGGREWKVGPGEAFLAKLPSAHEYLLPAESPGWVFFWFSFDHRWVVDRLSKAAAERPVVAFPSESRVAEESVAFFSRCCRGQFEDPWAEEEGVLSWMLGLERHLHDLAHPRREREKWLEQVREFVAARLRRSFGIEDVAASFGMSRTHFSHQFQRATGWSPAAYVVELRLREARRYLLDTPNTLAEIAGLTGFADANHFCKVFRRVQGMSPGTYRMRRAHEAGARLER